jgi:nicotinate-nucleotide pyrophosphorylase (carboxylating)
MTDLWLADLVRRALEEDVGPGDVTSRACLSAEQAARAVIVAREPGVLSGLEAAREVFRQVNPEIEFRGLLGEGDAFAAEYRLSAMAGPARDLLIAERVALNFLQRLCGVATLTRRYVEAIAGTGARIVDTRKTTPGLRRLEKAAVRAGGGHNHRFGLYDGVLIKDNHLLAAGGITAAVQAARVTAHQLLKIEVEIDRLDQLEEALAADADLVLLDNMSVEDLAEAVRRTAGRAQLEASGGVSLETVAAIAATGVDFISVGRLTHSVPAVDLSMEVEVPHSL